MKGRPPGFRQVCCWTFVNLWKCYSSSAYDLLIVCNRKSYLAEGGQFQSFLCTFALAVPDNVSFLTCLSGCSICCNRCKVVCLTSFFLLLAVVGVICVDDTPAVVL